MAYTTLTEAWKAAVLKANQMGLEGLRVRDANVMKGLGVAEDRYAIGFISSPAQGIAALVLTAREFCRRVEAGEVRSVKTYASFKNALQALDASAPMAIIDALNASVPSGLTPGS